MSPRSSGTQESLERAARRSGSEQYVLRLYVTGMTPRSVRAVENVRTICEEHLHGRYDLEVIDIYQQPTLAKGEQIIAAVDHMLAELPAGAAEPAQSPARRVANQLRRLREFCGLHPHMRFERTVSVAHSGSVPMAHAAPREDDDSRPQGFEVVIRKS